MSASDLLDRVSASIDAITHRPLYLQIADGIRSAIDDGALRPGEKLPSSAEFEERFGTTRNTVRAALQELINEGRVQTRRGVGAFVRQPIRDDAFVHHAYDRMARHYLTAGLSPVYVDAQSQGMSPEAVRQDQLVLKEVDAPRRVAEWLEVGPGTKVFLRQRRLLMGASPTQLTKTYLPLELATGALREDWTGAGGTHARIEELGYDLTESVERLSGRMPTQQEMSLLHLDPGVPVVDLVQTTYAGERPVEHFVAVIAADRYVFRYEIDAT